MSESYQDVGDRIPKAVDALKDQEKLNIVNVSKDRLFRRWKGVQSRSNRPRTNLRLSAVQEEVPCRYLDVLIENDTDPRHKQITAAADAVHTKMLQVPHLRLARIGPKASYVDI